MYISFLLVCILYLVSTLISVCGENINHFMHFVRYVVQCLPRLSEPWYLTLMAISKFTRKKNNNSEKYIFCSEEEKKLYRFGTTWGRVSKWWQISLFWVNYPFTVMTKVCIQLRWVPLLRQMKQWQSTTGLWIWLKRCQKMIN